MDCSCEVNGGKVTLHIIEMLGWVDWSKGGRVKGEDTIEFETEFEFEFVKKEEIEELDVEVEEKEVDEEEEQVSSIIGEEQDKGDKTVS